MPLSGSGVPQQFVKPSGTKKRRCRFWVCIFRLQARALRPTDTAHRGIAYLQRDGHRVAFNEAFKDVGLDNSWDVAPYGELPQIAGGKERLRHYFDTRGWPDAAIRDKDGFLARMHKRASKH